MIRLPVEVPQNVFGKLHLPRLYRYSDSLPIPSNPWCLPWADFERKQANLKELGVGGTLRRMP